MKCPECGSKEIEYDKNLKKYICYTCGLMFFESDALTDKQISRIEGMSHIG